MKSSRLLEAQVSTGKNQLRRALREKILIGQWRYMKFCWCLVVTRAHPMMRRAIVEMLIEDKMSQT